MPNWISGCKIKLYEKPLTYEQLDKLHQPKWWQAKKELEIDGAQEEAKARAHKKKVVKDLHMNWSMLVCNLQMSNQGAEMEEEAPRPIITVQLGDKRLMACAFINSGTNCKTISYELFQQLGHHKLQSS